MTSTAEVLAELRERALAKAKTRQTGPSTGELAKRRRSGLQFSMEQRRAELDAQAQELAAREQELAEARRAMQRQALDDLVEFLSLMSGGAGSAEAREVIAEHEDLLRQLGVTAEQLLRSVERRRAAGRR